MEHQIQPAPEKLTFGPLGGEGKEMVPAMALALAGNFGSVERWRDEFVAIGKALADSPGWVLLCFQTVEGTLVNRRAADETHLPAGAVPLLALRPDEPDVDAFMRNIDWASVYERYQHAVHGASEAFGVERSEVAGLPMLDVRRAGVFEQAEQMIAGASWRDPAAVGQWGASLPKDREVVVYCIYGHEVGRSTAMRLRAQGVKARFLLGGMDGWKTAGMPVEPKKGGA